MFEWLTSEIWASWRANVTALGGLAALGVAARTYSLNSRSKREEHPRLVFSRLSSVVTLFEGQKHIFPDVDPFYAGLTGGLNPSTGYATEPALACVVDVFNQSKEVVGPVWVRLAYSQTEWEDSPGIVFPALAPDASVQAHLVGRNEVHHGRHVLRPIVSFRDSAGLWWERIGTEPIHQLRVAPRLASPTEDPNVSSNFRAISLGNGCAFSAFPAWKTWLFDTCISRLPVIGPPLCNGKWRGWLEERAMRRLNHQANQSPSEREMASSD